MIELIELAALAFLGYAVVTGRLNFLIENIRRAADKLMSDPDKK